MHSDIVIIGAGVFGLWIARRCAAVGRSITVIEQAGPAAGASGGPLGALGPYVPDGWSPKKQFQLQALHSLSGDIDQLEEQTGMTTGYRRCGRVQPLWTESARQRAEARAIESRVNWQLPDGTAYQMTVNDEASGDPMDQMPMPYGYLHDDLTARLHPRAYCLALKAACVDDGVKFHSGRVVWVDDASGTVGLADGQHLAAAQIVVAAGQQSFGLLEPVVGRLLGHGVKGRVAVVAAPSSNLLPLIYTKGCYIVSHDNGEVAVGSTTEDDLADQNNQALETLMDTARMLVPALAGKEILRTWAGYRPNASIRAPLVGAVGTRIWAATGGFGIGLGIAHRIGRIIADQINGSETIDHPANFDPSIHLEATR